VKYNALKAVAVNCTPKRTYDLVSNQYSVTVSDIVDSIVIWAVPYISCISNSFRLYHLANTAASVFDKVSRWSKK